MNINTKKAKGNALLLLTAFIWGIAFVAQSAGMDYVGPFAFLFARSVLGGLVLIPCIFLMDHLTPEAEREKKRQMPKRPLLIGGVCCGCVLFLASSLQQYGIQYTTVGKAGFITALYIIIVPFLRVFTGQRIRRKLWISVALAVVGMYFLCITEGFSISAGDFLELLCAVAFACHILVIDHFSPQVDGVRMSCIQFFVCGAGGGEHAAGGAGVFFGDDPGVAAHRLCGRAVQRCRVYAADPGPEGHRPGGGVSSDEYGIGVCHAGGLGAAGAGAVAPGDVGLRAGFCRDHPGAAVEHAKKT